MSPAFHSPPPGLPYAATDAGILGHLRRPTSRLSDRANPSESGNPFSASSTAGMTSAFHASLPHFLCAAAMPRTVPGTPGAR